MDESEVKRINHWKQDETKHDEDINELIPHYKGIAEEWCNQSFSNPFPYGVKQFIAKSIQRDFHVVMGISSRAMGSVNYSFDNETDKKIKENLRPYRKLRWG
ncbi:phage head-tail connector protein [Salinicoccus albus]|uniref:phage head-tail connector protein n=1 Tax=Salinicoccus albus TaxID=418756 RepID=UPI00036E12A8|nr:phage head-tail connector protein [Salinicoccus albus]